MRTKAIILGAIAALALASLTASAANDSHQTATAGSVKSLAATTLAIKADRDEPDAALRATAAPATTITETVAAPPTSARSAAAHLVVSAACRDALNALKALRQADAAEDATERAAGTTSADLAEDLAEAQQWKNALITARTACLPQLSAACQSAITNLQALLQAARNQSLANLRPANFNLTWLSNWTALKAAFAAAATACATVPFERD